MILIININFIIKFILTMRMRLIIIFVMFEFYQYKQDVLITDLHQHEKLIIWGAREWLKLIRIAKDPRKSLINGFSQMLVQESVVHFDKLMRIIACNAINPIDIRNQCCLEIGKGEKSILASITFSQSNFENYNKKLLSSFIDKNSVYDGCKCIDEIANSFTRMGYFFQVKNEYLNLAGENPNNFKNVVFNRFNKNDFMKYF